MTDKIFRENRNMGRAELSETLRRLLQVDELIFIPEEPGDVIGHADGVVRFVSRDSVIVNDYRDVDREYGAEIRRRMNRAGLRTIALPYKPIRSRRESIPSAFGNYANFLETNRLLVVPSYGIDEDAKAMSVLREAFSCTIAELDCRNLAADGGVLNCCTWAIP